MEVAGDFRQSNKNIGVDWLMVSIELKKLLDDLIFQIEKILLMQMKQRCVFIIDWF